MMWFLDFQGNLISTSCSTWDEESPCYLPREPNERMPHGFDAELCGMANCVGVYSIGRTPTTFCVVGVVVDVFQGFSCRPPLSTTHPISPKKLSLCPYSCVPFPSLDMDRHMSYMLLGGTDTIRL